MWRSRLFPAVPAGQWKVLRIGYTLTGRMTSWSSSTGLGLEEQISSDGEDLSFVEVRIVDKDGNLCPKDGNLCPNADQMIRCAIEGPGVIAGVDNGDPTSHAPFKATQHKAFHGLCLGVTKAARTPREIRLSVTPEGLVSEPVVITISR